MTSREVVSYAMKFGPNMAHGAFLSTNQCKVFRNELSKWYTDSSSLQLTTTPGSVWGDFGKKVPASNLLCVSHDAALVPSPLFSKFLKQPYCPVKHNGQSVYIDFTKDPGQWFAFTTVTVNFEDYGEQAGLFLMGEAPSLAAEETCVLLPSVWVKLVLERLKDGNTRAVFGLSNASSPRVVAKVDLKAGNASSRTCSLALVVSADYTLAAFVATDALADPDPAAQQLTLQGVHLTKVAELSLLPDPAAVSVPVVAFPRVHSLCPAHTDAEPASPDAQTLCSVPLRVTLAAHGAASEETPRSAAFSRVVLGRYDDISRDAHMATHPADSTTTAMPSLGTLLRFSHASAAEVPALYATERVSYPEDEAASLENLQLRQAVASDYFMVAKTTSTALRQYVAAQREQLTVQGADLSAIEEKVAASTAPGADGLITLGYVCGTVSAGTHLHHDTMSAHDGTGSTLCIHSVCVDAAFRRLGVAHAMLRHYIDTLKRAKAESDFAAAMLAQCGYEPSSAPDAPESTPVSRVTLPLFAVDRVLLLSKEHNCGLYTRAGWVVDGVSDVCHGQEQWMQCSLLL